MGFIVAIDGPAGSGKGTIANLVSQKFNLVNIDTGAMYRCVTLECLNNNIEYTDLEKIEEVLKNIKIELKFEDEEKIILLNGKDVSRDIREPRIDASVSKFSAIKIVRDKMTNLQREMGEKQNVVMEGRDIGTVVFPNADVKIYLECSSEERANRRYKQNVEKGIKCTYEEVYESIMQRNKLDKKRDIAPLVKADDAILVDSTNLSIEEVFEEVAMIIKIKIDSKF